MSYVFKQGHNHNQFHMHNINQSILEADIQSYINFHLSPEQVQKAAPQHLDILLAPNFIDKSLYSIPHKTMSIHTNSGT
jgi:hypothetical protein